MTMKVVKNTNDGVIYANSSDFGYTVRIKQGKAGKNLNGIATSNHTTEIIINDDVDVVVGGVSAVDALSVRIRTSCAKESLGRLAKILDAVVADLPVMADEDVFAGFLPATAPTVPTA